MMHVDVDIGSNTMAKKIRSGQLQQYNFVFGISRLPLSSNRGALIVS